MSISFLPITVGLLATAFLILLLNPLAQRVGWLDNPCARKQHAAPIPLTGGVAMCAAFGVALVATQGLEAPFTLLAAMVLMCLIGLWDDVHHGYDVYGPSWDLAEMEHVKAYAEECRDEHLSNLILAKRKKDARDADLVSGMI